jgi:hypothetical protein
MFDTDGPGSVFAAVSPPADVAASAAEPARVPLERLEAQICELAGHLAAATCRFLVLLASPMTASQLERFARAHRQVTRADDADARVRRRLTWRFEQDGSLSGTFRLPPLQGAVLLKALRAACADLAGLPAGPPAGVSAETSPARCHVEDGPAISVSTAQMIACTAALSWMRHGDAGEILALGRRRRRPSSAIRRAARERDHGRCRFPGCESRRVDLHHIQHWVNGGRTDLDNLISLCPCHHKLVHDRGYLIAASPPGGFAFYRPDGTPLPVCPPLPEPDGPIDQAHDADITPDTIIPPWYGERLDLDHAIWACFANARTRQERQQDPDGTPRGRVTIYEPQDCVERYRQYLERTPRYTGPTLIPIQV